VTQGTFSTPSRTYVAIDLETTGLQPKADEIIEIGAVLFDEDGVRGTFDRLVSPGRKLTQFITLLTGISDSDLEDAPAFEEIADDLRAFISDHAIVGQNVSFDLNFLAAKGIRPAGPVFDTRNLSRTLRPDATEHGLAILAANFGVVNDSAHRALSDADTTRRVFLEFRKSIGALTSETVAAASGLAAIAASDWPEGALFTDEAALRQLASGTSEGAVAAAVQRAHEDQEQRNQRSGGHPGNIEPGPVEIGALFQSGGAVERVLEGYEPRSQQVEMASVIAQTMENGGTFLVEAPPGTGKSLAYLVPALAFGTANETSVVVSTSTRGLQEQLAVKDLPVALQVLGMDPSSTRIAVLKGRGNYLCYSRLAQELGRPDINGDQAAFFARILVWLETTARGDIGELGLFDAETQLWPVLSAGGDEEHASCEFQRQGVCFAARARKAAQDAALVITNHSLLLADSAREGAILGHAKHLILDEAHHLEREATAQFGRAVTARDTNDLLGALGARDGRPRIVASAMGEAVSTGASDRASEIASRGETVGTTARTALEAVRIFFGLVSVLATREAGQQEGDAVLRVTGATREAVEWTPIRDAWSEVQIGLSAVTRSFSTLIDGMEGVVQPYTFRSAEDLSRSLAEIRSTLEFVMDGSASDGIVWIKGTADQRGTIGIHWAPLSTAALLESGLFEGRDSVTLTSGTLTAGGNFQHIRTRLGIESTAELRLDSPFDHAAAVRSFIPEDMPPPDASNYRRAVEQAIAQIASVADGGVLVLFTSYSALRQAYNYLRPALEAQGISVLGQGVDGTPARLIEMQRANPKTVLLGAATFWEGVDLAGDALRVLIIPRLPFAVPTDPIVAARGETYADPFGEFTLPESLLRFRQGLGRLIRTGTDHGAIVVMDTRVLTRRYGQAFIGALPSDSVATPKLSHLSEAVADWLYDRQVRV
jgi:predicted DnaQ family exonuclease/DinG family helicase